MNKLKINRIRCKKCGDIIDSQTRHDFRVCQCGTCGIDGGHDYAERCWEPQEDPNDIPFEDLSTYEEDEL